jgi:hypothetical protein
VRLHRHHGSFGGGFGWFYFEHTLIREYVQVGAVLVYTPEHGMSLDTLRTDVRFLKNRYALDVKGKSEGRLVIRSVLIF